MLALNDLRYSLRLLTNSPGFTAVTLVVIVLGLSLFLTSFTFTRQIASEPMPFPNGERYVTLGANDGRSGFMLQRTVHDALSFSMLRENAESFSLLGAYRRTNVVLSGEEFPQRYLQASITPELLATTAVQPMLGRMLNSNDSQPSGSRAAIIGHDIWSNFFAADPDIVGQSVGINGEPTTIVGVMPEGFGFPRGVELWTPLMIAGGSLPGDEPLNVVGILGPGATADSARLETEALMQALFQEHPDYDTNRVETILPYAALYPWGFSLPDIMLYIAWSVLGLAVVNLSSLLFVRLSSRKQELLIRSSVGANGAHLVKQVLTETFVLCFLGLVLTVALSSVLLQILRIAWGVDVPYWVDFELDMQGLLVACLTTTAVWLISGIAIAYRAYSSNPGDVSADSPVTGKGKRNSSQYVVAVEVVLSCFLLVCCGGAIYLFQLAYNTDYGVEVENAVVASFSFANEGYSDSSQRITYLTDLFASIEPTYGIEAVAATSSLPHRMGRRGTFTTPDIEPGTDDDSFRQSTISVSANYFDAMGASIVEGRAFDGTDTLDSEAVAVISDEFAGQFWADESAIGKQVVSITDGEEQRLTIVGVTSLILQSEYDFERLPSIYRPLTQYTPDSYYLLAKHSDEVTATDLEPAIRSAALGVDRDLPVENIRPLNEQIVIDKSGVGGFALLFVEFTIATLLLASIGIYAVIARSIYLRTHEIGVRRALGSTDIRLIIRFLKKGSYFLAAGIVFGAIPALALSVMAFSVMAPIGNQVIAYMPTISLSAVMIVSLLIIIASYIPAKRAVALEPGDALRYE